MALGFQEMSVVWSIVVSRHTNAVALQEHAIENIVYQIGGHFIQVKMS